MEKNNWRQSSYKSSSSSISSNPHSNYNNNDNNNKNPRNFRKATSNSSYNNNNNTQTPISTQPTLDDIQPIIGTCPFMCPEKERSQREKLRDLALFERLYGNSARSSSTLAVKKFCRTISTKDVQATDLRPLPVLRDTLNYLMKLLDSSDQPFEVVHDFIFDRTRSIRQDLSMQNINNEQVICMYEEMVKFHIISHHKLKRCKGDSTIISSIHYLNKEQLTKCLSSLYNLYDANRTSDCIFDNEAEFRSLHILLNLDSQSHSTGESLSLWFSRLPSFIIKSKKMCFARNILRFYRMSNFFRFFRTIAAEATYLQFYVIESYITKVWGRALECINSSGYKLHPYPLASLSKILMIKELDLETLCNACCLEISEDDAGNKVLPSKQTSFCHPKDGFQNLDSSLLELLQT